MSSQLSWSIIKQFSGRNTFGFTIQDVVREFLEKNRAHLARILADMVDKGMLYGYVNSHVHQSYKIYSLLMRTTLLWADLLFL